MLITCFPALSAQQEALAYLHVQGHSLPVPKVTALCSTRCKTVLLSCTYVVGKASKLFYKWVPLFQQARSLWGWRYGGESEKRVNFQSKAKSNLRCGSLDGGVKVDGVVL